MKPFELGQSTVFKWRRQLLPFSMRTPGTSPLHPSNGIFDYKQFPVLVTEAASPFVIQLVIPNQVISKQTDSVRMDFACPEPIDLTYLFSCTAWESYLVQLVCLQRHESSPLFKVQPRCVGVGIEAMENRPGLLVASRPSGYTGIIPQLSACHLGIPFSSTSCSFRSGPGGQSDEK